MGKAGLGAGREPRKATGWLILLFPQRKAVYRLALIEGDPIEPDEPDPKVVEDTRTLFNNLHPAFDDAKLNLLGRIRAQSRRPRTSVGHRAQNPRRGAPAELASARRGEGMRALDLFAGAGGAALGYNQAGFDEIVGVDIRRQPNYPFEFIQADVLSLTPEFLRNFDLIHASPPCQFGTALKHMCNAKPHRNLIPQTRELLRASGKPYVIENVEGAKKHLVDPIVLCGSMFGPAPDGAQLQRHRLFEASFPLAPPIACRHRRGLTIGIYGAHLRDRRRPAGTNHPERQQPAVGTWLYRDGYGARDDDAG